MISALKFFALSCIVLEAVSASQIDCSLNALDSKISLGLSKCNETRTEWIGSGEQEQWEARPEVCLFVQDKVVTGWPGSLPVQINLGQLRSFFSTLNLALPYDICAAQIEDLSNSNGFLHKDYFTQGDLEQMEADFEQLIGCVKDTTVALKYVASWEEKVYRPVYEYCEGNQCEGICADEI